MLRAKSALHHFSLAPALILSLAIFCLNGESALGGLGDHSSAGVSQDMARHRSIKHVLLPRTSSPYTVHQLVSSSNTINEYVSAGDVVFALCWNGLTHPNVEEYIGTYLSDYQTAKHHAPKRAGKRSSEVRGQSIVVHMSGHMGKMQGCAYDSALVPAGVKTSELK